MVHGGSPPASPRGPDETVVDESLARQHGISVGSSADILGARFRVVGLSEGTRSWMFGFVFVTLDAARASGFSLYRRG